MQSYPSDDQVTYPSSSGANKRKRPYVSQACLRCRGRKMKCNGQQPQCDMCERAARKGKTVECVFEEDKRKSKTRAQMSTRLIELEEQLAASKGQATPSIGEEDEDEDNDEVSAQDEDSEEVAAAPFGTGSLSLGPDGDLRHEGFTSSFFRTYQATTMDTVEPVPAPLQNKPYLLMPHLPVNLSPSLHEQLIHMAFYSFLDVNYMSEEDFRLDLKANCNQRTSSYSRFLHLIVLAIGCRYVDNLPELLDGTEDGQREPGDVFVDAAKTLVDFEAENPKLSSILGFNTLSTIMVGKGSDRLANMYQAIATMTARDFRLEQRCSSLPLQMTEQDQIVDQQRRRMYWSCTIQDGFWTAYTGQPSVWPGEACHQDYPPINNPSAIPTAFHAFPYQARLAKIGVRIIKKIYTKQGQHYHVNR